MREILLPTGVVCTGDAFADRIGDVAALRGAPIDLSMDGDTVEEVAANIPSVGEAPFVVIGLSMGGIVAMELLRQRPDDIAAVALIATNHDVPASSRLNGSFPILDPEAFDLDIEAMALHWFGRDDASAYLPG